MAKSHLYPLISGIAVAKRMNRSDPFVARMEAKRQAEWQARLAKEGGDEAAKEKPTWRSRAAAAWTTTRTVVLNVVGVVGFVGMVFLLCEAVTQPTIAVAPIATPKELIEKGYTSEAAGEELRAALNKIVEAAHSRKHGADVAAQTEILNITVPHTGLSIETIGAQLRKLFGRANRWAVSGGIVSGNNGYVFRLRIANDKDSPKIIISPELKHIDDLFILAAHGVLEVADPFLFAASFQDVTPNYPK